MSVKIEYRHGDGGSIVYDANRLDQADPRLFDAHYWRSRDALAGGAEGRGTTWFVQQGESQLALRRYRRGGVAARLLGDRYLWTGLERTRAWREWRLTADLYLRGLPVPAPIAARVERCGPFYRADLITQRIPAVESLSQRLRSCALSAEGWRRLGAQLRAFHAVGLDHADLNAHNILVNARDEFWLIDFDKARLRRPGAWMQRNLDRLHRSLRKLHGASTRFAWTESDWTALQEGYALGGPAVTRGSPEDSAPESAAVRRSRVAGVFGSRLGTVLISAAIAYSGFD